MSATGFARQRDRNEPGIVAALEAVGCHVTRLGERGVPDLLVGYRGTMYLIEVKLPLGTKGGKNGSELNEAQVAWWEAFTGPRPTLARSPEDALRAIGCTVTAPGLYTWCGACDGRDTSCPRPHVTGTYPQAKKPPARTTFRKIRSKAS